MHKSCWCLRELWHEARCLARARLVKAQAVLPTNGTDCPVCSFSTSSSKFALATTIGNLPAWRYKRDRGCSTVAWKPTGAGPRRSRERQISTL